MSDVKTLNIAGNDFDIKDIKAREDISMINSNLSNLNKHETFILQIQTSAISIRFQTCYKIGHVVHIECFADVLNDIQDINVLFSVPEKYIPSSTLNVGIFNLSGSGMMTNGWHINSSNGYIYQNYTSLLKANTQISMYIEYYL